MLLDSPRETTYSFRDVFEALASALNFDEVLNRILTVAMRELRADQGSLLLLQGEEHPQLKMLASIGLPEEIVRRGYIPRKGSISEYVLLERRPVIINGRPEGFSGADRFRPIPESETGVRRRIVSALCVPLIARGSVLGTMNLNRTSGTALFSEQDLEACSIVAGQAAIVIENRRLQEELLRKERLAAVGETVAGISHCVKNILSGVKGGVGLTQMGLDSGNEALMREGFDLLKRSCGTLTNLVLDLLDYSKEREPVCVQFDLAEIIGRVAETIAHKAQVLGVEVKRDEEPALRLCGDSDQIFRALLNLATNAVEAAGGHRRADEAPTVVLRTRRLAADDALVSDCGPENGVRGWFLIEVADNGAGIPEEHREQIWNLFFSTKGSRGTGIGLATTRKMVQEHGGTIRLETSPDWGTSFRVLLPEREA